MLHGSANYLLFAICYVLQLVLLILLIILLLILILTLTLTNKSNTIKQNKAGCKVK